MQKTTKCNFRALFWVLESLRKVYIIFFFINGICLKWKISLQIVRNAGRKMWSKDSSWTRQYSNIRIQYDPNLLKSIKITFVKYDKKPFNF